MVQQTQEIAQSQTTALYERHPALGARVLEFAGWEMRPHYAGGIVKEHLATRRYARLFDVSHMGGLMVRGKGSNSILGPSRFSVG
ncbi:MAG: hypothetical protein JRI56_10220 [Deltaproteobacteria bacterium]|nr:hypothetical protein [Deltaproteobacteria bacterium]